MKALLVATLFHGSKIENLSSIMSWNQFSYSLHVLKLFLLVAFHSTVNGSRQIFYSIHCLRQHALQ